MIEILQKYQSAVTHFQVTYYYVITACNQTYAFFLSHRQTKTLLACPVKKLNSSHVFIF